MCRWGHDASSVADSSRCREQLGKSKSSLERSCDACLKIKRVNEKRVTWRGERKEEIGRMNSQWKTTERRYARVLQEWRELCVFPELSLAPPVASLPIGDTTVTTGKIDKTNDRNETQGSPKLLYS